MNRLPHRALRPLLLVAFVLLATVLGRADSRVWVQFQPGSKGPVMAALAQAGGRVHHEFDQLNAVAVTMPEQALAGLSRNPNVLLVEEDPIRIMSGQAIPYGIEMVQAYNPAAPLPADGGGIVVGVIDSGVFAAHEDLPDARLRGEPKPVNAETDWNRDRDSHGTHVVGTIAAAWTNNLGVIGVAPGVEIYMVKVFGDTGNWIYSSTLLKAVDQAVTNGPAKIVSMSLGGGAPSQTEKTGLQSHYNNGILLIAAAGNAGNTTTSYPAGYPSVMSVAAVDSNKLVADFSQKNKTVEIAAPGVGVLSTVSYKKAALTVGGTEYLAGAMEGTLPKTNSGPLVNGGRATTVGSWSGNVVLVERGDISFADKVANVQTGGGVAAVIYNNAPGGFSGTLSPSTSTIPVISITQEDGQALINSRLDQSATVSTLAAFDVSGYDYFDGTSMATPHVSGVAALIWSQYKSASNAQVRQALISSAQDLGPEGLDNSYGYGLVQAAAALNRLGELVGGGGGGGGGTDSTPPEIGPISTATAKGKAGTFTISFTTDEPATALVSVQGLGSATTALGTSHSVKVQGTKGELYSGTVTATDTAGNPSAKSNFTHQN